MKQFIMILALAVASLSTYAQGGNSPEERATSYTEWVNKQVTLTAEQLPQVKAITLDVATKAVEAEQIANAEEQTAKIKTLNEERDAKLKAVLTPEQWAKYEAALAAEKTNAPQTPATQPGH